MTAPEIQGWGFGSSAGPIINFGSAGLCRAGVLRIKENANISRSRSSSDGGGDGIQGHPLTFPDLKIPRISGILHAGCSVSLFHFFLSKKKENWWKTDIEGKKKKEKKKEFGNEKSKTSFLKTFNYVKDDIFSPEKVLARLFVIIE